jgi:hypothetical protein
MTWLQSITAEISLSSVDASFIPGNRRGSITPLVTATPTISPTTTAATSATTRGTVRAGAWLLATITATHTLPNNTNRWMKKKGMVPSA